MNKNDGAVTSEKKITISTAQELAELASKVNSGEDFSGITISLMSDIDLSGYTDGGGWTPIGSEDHPFCGIFDGGKNTISNITIKRPSELNQGLFGKNNGTVKNLIIKNSDILGDSYIGAVAGCGDGIIEHCDSIDNRIAGQMYVGGIIGLNGDSTTDCINRSDIIGEDGFIGGIAGMNAYGSSIINCINAGCISGGREVGGITGSHNERLERCFNTGNVKGKAFYVGGITGSCGDTDIRDCYNTGHVTGEGAVGGIVGSCGHSVIGGCYNAGKVEGNESVGGITGVDDAMIGESYTDKDKCVDNSPNVINLSTQEMTANDVLTGSMSGFGESWCKRTNDTHSYYPELSVFRDDPTKTELSRESVKAI